MFSIEYDKSGNFRIVHLASGITSEWVSYRQVAVLGYAGDTYIAISGFLSHFPSSRMPIDKVCKVEIQETILSKVQHQVASLEEDVDIIAQQQKEGG